MTTLELLKSKRGEIFRLAKRYGVVRIRAFGSVVRGEVRKTSDIDFLVAFERGRSLLDLIGFKQDLEELLGRSVDVVSEGGVSPYLRKQIFEQAVPL